MGKGHICNSVGRGELWCLTAWHFLATLLSALSLLPPAPPGFVEQRGVLSIEVRNDALLGAAHS